MTAFLRRLLRHRDAWVIVLLGAFILFVAVNTQTGWLYLVVAMLVVLLALGFVGPSASLRGLEVSRAPIAPVREGELATVRLHVRNPSRWTRTLVVLHEVAPFPVAPSPSQELARIELPPHPWNEKPTTVDLRLVRFVIGAIPPRASATVEYRTRGAVRGVWSVSETHLACTMPFGLFTSERRVEAPGTLVVHPREAAPTQLDALYAAVRGAGTTAPSSRAGHSYDLRGIHPYQIGDDIRFIHWATTARTGQLAVRQFNDLGAAHLTVLIDTGARSGEGPPGNRPIDEAARVAARIIAMARHLGTRVTLVAPDADGRLATLREARGDEALDWLARVCTVDTVSWGEALRQCTAARGPKGAMVVLVADPAPAAMGERGDGPVPRLAILFPRADADIGTRAIFEEAAERLRAAGVDAVVHAAEPSTMDPVAAAAGASS